jgi:hypothetical protein
VTGLVVLVVVVSCIVLVALEVTGPRQPATTAPPTRRGPSPSPGRADSASEPDPAWPPPTTGPVHLPADASRGVAARLPDEAPRRARTGPVESIRWWQRLRSAVMLAVMAVVLGALLAAVIGAGALLLLNLLRSSVT